MRIVQIAGIDESVQPQQYGGSELVVSNITEGMVERGHEVYLLAAGDSHTSATLKPLVPQGLRKAYAGKDSGKWHSFYQLRAVADALEFINEVRPDVVYNHLTWQIVMFNKFISCPLFTTVHGSMSSFYERTTFQNFPQAHYISLSNAQRKAMPEINWVQTIYNGINVDTYQFDQEAQRDYFVFCGRVSPDEGLADIMQMIKKTNYRLKVAAHINPVNQEYFHSQIEPLIDGEQIEFLGELDQDGKNEFFRHAIGLLQFLHWEEPSNTGILEAMACGVPVIVNARGGIPELVTDGETGCFISSIDEMQACMEKVQELDTMKIRQHVRMNFSSDRMVDEYLSLAYDVRNGE